MVEFIKTFAPLASALIALTALVMSTVALITSARVARTQIFIELRKRFAEVNSQLPKGIPPDANDYHDASWRPNAKSPELPRLERYWFHTFDEWYVTRVLHPWPFRRLWTAFYERAVYEGLKHQAIRDALKIMVDDRHTSFSGCAQRFAQDHIAVYRKYKSGKGAKVDWTGFDVEPAQKEFVKSSDGKEKFPNY